MTVVTFVRPEPELLVEPVARPPVVGAGTARSRLRFYGGAMSFGFLVVLVAWVATQIGCLLSMFLHFRSGIVTGTIDGTLAFRFSQPLGYLDLVHARSQGFSPATFSSSVAAAYTAILVTAAVPFCSALVLLSRLFRFYSRGEVFTDRNTIIMRRIGHSVMATGYLPLLLGPAAHAIGVLKPVTGVTGGMIAFLFMGLILLAISDVMTIGQGLQQDQEEIL